MHSDSGRRSQIDRRNGNDMVVTAIPQQQRLRAQINTLFVKQGTTLDRHLGSTFQIPAASLGSFVTLTMLLSVPMVPHPNSSHCDCLCDGSEKDAHVFNAIGLLEFFYDQSPEDMQSLNCNVFHKWDWPWKFLE
ncbi:hypothetical protein HAX54_025664 [Datura stramonium]|uniref:Uncharacterized protein n=1 Tax=Datura stramonium TaxID=4076 RepID=A0ABS8S6Z6_DATST|nr:hypothetical protein [Datura stramonium]